MILAMNENVIRPIVYIKHQLRYAIERVFILTSNCVKPFLAFTSFHIVRILEK